MLAGRLTPILPAMTVAEAIETTRIHRVAGLTGDRTALVTTRSCRAPHHTISDVGLIGGGHVPMQGEVSLAHNGVLFLDELPEFRRHVLEVLRQPLENGVLYRQSRGHPRSLYICGVRHTSDGREGCGLRTIADGFPRDGDSSSNNERSSCSSGCAAVPCFSLDTRARLEY
jgi:Magnesium chelatase, subunit ChlI